jgi:cytidylate kinase
MYRAVALLGQRAGLDARDESAIESLLEKLQLGVKWFGPEMHVFVNGEDVTATLRSPEIDHSVRLIAALAPTRKKLLPLQRKIAKECEVVMEGRDIGSVVLPDANLKIFLDASPQVRAERRWKEHQARGENLTLTQVIDEVRQRDKLDKERENSPLICAPDAVFVDNTAMSVNETVRLIVMLVRDRQRHLASAAGGEP